MFNTDENNQLVTHKLERPQQALNGHNQMTTTTSVELDVDADGDPDFKLEFFHELRGALVSTGELGNGYGSGDTYVTGNPAHETHRITIEGTNGAKVFLRSAGVDASEGLLVFANGDEVGSVSGNVSGSNYALNGSKRLINSATYRGSYTYNTGSTNGNAPGGGRFRHRC